jgi:hypothetical protein
MNAHSDPEAQHPEAESSGSRRSGRRREWIKAGSDPLRYEYGRPGQNPSSPAVVGQIAFVEEEKRSSYFHWETYQSHKKGARPSLEEAQEAAIEALKEEGQL